MLADAGKVVSHDGRCGAEHSCRCKGMHNGLDAVEAKCPSEEVIRNEDCDEEQRCRAQDGLYQGLAGGSQPV